MERQGLVDGNNVFGLGPAPKPDVGDPLRVRMRPGDVVIAHQRLGHSGGINLHPAIRKNLYFRIRHKRHPALLQEAWSGSLWTEYESLHTMTGYVKGTGKQ